MHGGEYAIRGTNRPASIGLVFRGGTRMYNSDIQEPYRPVSSGAPVVVER